MALSNWDNTLREYIEAENRRLEQDSEQFWAKEIVVKIEYKYCPNLLIIDTPGLSDTGGNSNDVGTATPAATMAICSARPSCKPSAFQ